MRSFRVVRAQIVGLAAGCAVVACAAGPPPPAAGPTTGRATTATARPTSSRPAASVPPAPRPPAIDFSAPPAQVLARRPVPVLTYHQIRPWTAADSASARTYVMPPAAFRAQLAELARHANPISANQLLAYLTTGAPLPPRPVLLTFDDADEDGWTVALPELRRRHFPAVFFVMTVVLGHRGYFSPDQVRQLAAAGMTIGAHTWDHHRVDRYAGADWQVQIDRPVRELTRITGRPVRLFAYPYGMWSRAAFAHLRAAGIGAAFQLSGEPMDRGSPLLTIRRRIADPTWSTVELDRVLSGAG